MAEDRSDDALFLSTLRKKKLIESYSSLKNKLPIKNIIEPKNSFKLPKAITIRASIRDSAVTKKLLRITYKKETTNETKIYLVEPYSFRYVPQNGGLRKALYAWDHNKNSIKYFFVKNITKAENTTIPYQARFPIEIARGLKDLYEIKKQKKH
jgi:predicted DNA-binding transcriptional regulator YafY